MTAADELLDQLIGPAEEALARHRVPGLALAVADLDGIVSRHFGHRHHERGGSIDDATIFQVGSISKIVTGTTVMRLVEQGVLELDVPVLRWLPDLELADGEAQENVTLRHLLEHTGGWNGDYAIETGRGDDALERVRPTLAAADQLTPLGTVYHYNNLGFVLTGLVIQAATSSPFEAVVRELILDPLGMTRSRYFPEEIIFERIAAGHIVNADGRTVSPYGRPRSRAPNGGVLSCVEDLVTFGRFHLAGGVGGDGRRLMNTKLIDAMQVPEVPAGIDDVYRGIAWVVSDRYGTRLVSHGGATPGFQSGFWILPEHGLVVVALTNASTGGTPVRAIERAIQQHFHGDMLPRSSVRIDVDGFDSIRGVYSSVAGAGAVAVDGSSDKPVLHTFLGGLEDPVAHPLAASTAPDRYEIVDGPGTGNQFDMVLDGRYLRFNGSRLFERVSDGGRSLARLVDRYPALGSLLAVR